MKNPHDKQGEHLTPNLKWEAPEQITQNQLYTTPNPAFQYEIDLDKIKTIDDLVTILKAFQLSFRMSKDSDRLNEVEKYLKK